MKTRLLIWILTKDFPSGEPLNEVAAKMSNNWTDKYNLFQLEKSEMEDITQGPDNLVGQRLGY